MSKQFRMRLGLRVLVLTVCARSVFTISLQAARSRSAVSTFSAWPVGATNDLLTPDEQDFRLRGSYMDEMDEATGPSSNSSSQDARCIKNTGGTCLINACFQRRGPTTCSWGGCYCDSNLCSSVDGVCIDQYNELIQEGFTLRNARWPDYYMTVEKFRHGLGVSSTKTPRSSFSLYRLPESPEKSPEPFPPGFLLASEEWPNLMVTIWRFLSCSAGFHGNLSCGFEFDGTTRNVLNAHNSVQQVALNFLKAPAYPGAPKENQSVMIESLAYPGLYLSLSRLAWGVGAALNDPGAGAYWIADKHLNIDLLPYTGPKCKADCGFYGSGSGGANTWPLIMGIVIGWIACIAGSMLLVLRFFAPDWYVTKKVSDATKDVAGQVPRVLAVAAGKPIPVHSGGGGGGGGGAAKESSEGANRVAQRASDLDKRAAALDARAKKLDDRAANLDDSQQQSGRVVVDAASDLDKPAAELGAREKKLEESEQERTDKLVRRTRMLIIRERELLAREELLLPPEAEKEVPSFELNERVKVYCGSRKEWLDSVVVELLPRGSLHVDCRAFRKLIPLSQCTADTIQKLPAAAVGAVPIEDEGVESVNLDPK